jgi:Family of unknown function (DUF5317)
MTFPTAPPARRGRLLAIWAGGSAALIGMVVFSLATAAPYPAAWPWICFLAMAVLEEALVAPANGGSAAGPRIVLLATIIMFRKHPDITALVMVAAGLINGVLLRLPWRAALTRTAWLLIMAAAGTAALRIVGYGDTPHFVVATAVFILIYVGGTAVRDGAGPRLVRWLGVGLLGALMALGWRTPSTGPLMLRLGEVAILAVLGMAVGVALGGSPCGLLRGRLHLRGVPVLAIVGAAGLVISTRLPSQPAAILAAGGLTTIGVFAIRRGWFPMACLLLGGLCNEVARMVNGGHMPVNTVGLPEGVAGDLANLSETSTYRAVDGRTHLAWLADRFALAPFPGIASVGDIIIGLGVIWVFAALTTARPAVSGVDSAVVKAA